MSLVSVDGQIQNLNYTTRTFTMKDREGIVHPVKYAEGHTEMGKQKNYFFAKVTGEKDADGTIVLDVLGFFRKPDDWPASANNSGGKGGNYPPRDPKVQTYIIRQSCLDRATQIVLHGATIDAALPELVKEIRDVAEVLELWVLR